jgi:hypothetical protein
MTVRGLCALLTDSSNKTFISIAGWRRSTCCGRSPSRSRATPSVPWAMLLHGQCRCEQSPTLQAFVAHCTVIAIALSVSSACKLCVAACYTLLFAHRQGLIRHFRDEMEDRITQASERIAA